MIGVTIGNKHTFNDYDLIMTSHLIGTPKAKTEFVDVAGSDGVLDFTDFFGETKFKNRQITINLTSIMPMSDQIGQAEILKNECHGRRMKVVFDDDPDHYYMGRIDVGNWTHERNMGNVTITVDCDPWKYKINETIVSVQVNGEKTVNIVNSRRTVSPVIVTTGDVNINWDGGSVALSAGTWSVVSMIIKEGTTPITIIGNATVTFKYQEGSL